jgi:putative oxidoreductase
MIAHLTIDFNYIDININAENSWKFERNLMITTNALPAAYGKGRLITLWTLSSLAALAFIGAGSAKLAGAAAMVDMFSKVGLGQWFRYFTGLLEVAGAIGLLTSRYAFHAALLLATVMVGAIITHLTVLGGSPVPPLVLLVLSGTIAYLRKPESIHQQGSRA